MKKSNNVTFEQTATFDRGGFGFAQRKMVEYVFADISTGKIWQFLVRSNKEKLQKTCESLRGYPHMANCQMLSTRKYYKYFFGEYPEI